MNIRTLIIGLVTVFTLAGCSTQERMDYTDFTNSTPRSILVVVSQADTEDETAVPSVISSASLPLSEAGYYVIPVTSANDTLVRNGGRDPVSIRNIPHKKLKELFGADGILIERCFSGEPVEVGIAALLLGGVGENTKACSHEDRKVEGLRSLTAEGSPCAVVERVIKLGLVLSIFNRCA